VDKLDPENAPGFLVGRIAHRLKVHIRKFFIDSGIQLTAEELTILTALAHLDSAKSMNTLAELLGRDPTTLKRQLNGILKLGFVARTPSSKDGRVIVISITTVGRALVESTMPMSYALRERAMAGISEADKKVLVRCLSKMLNNLKDNNEASK
jgi:MarR family transcriptional repressor of emrRAB